MTDERSSAVLAWLRPLVLCAATLAGVVVAVAALMSLAPTVTPEQPEGAARWVSAVVDRLGALAVGDLGISTGYAVGAPVHTVVSPAFARSIQTVLLALLLAAAVVAPLVVWTGHSRRRKLTLDFLLMLTSCLPAFALAVIWREAAPGWLTFDVTWRTLTAAVVVLLVGDGFLVDLYRRLHAEYLAARNTHHVLSARLNADRPRLMLVLTAMPPAAELLVARVSLLLGAVIVVEIPLGIEGVGNVLYRAMALRDVNVMTGCVLLLAVTVCTAHLGSNLLQLTTDPRRRVGLGGNEH